MGWWAFVDMNAFFAACEQQDRPELRGKPVGVVPVMAETTCLIAASYEAKPSGVRTGTKVADALRLCPNLRLIEARPRLYRHVHKRLVAAVDHLVPVHAVLSIDELSIRPWANEGTLHEALRLGQAIQDEIRCHIGDWLSCSVGLAPNAFLAKVAADLQKPRGLSVIDRDDIPHKLLGLKLTDWPGIAGAMRARFEAAGVTTTEQMYALREDAMRQVFGGVNGNRWFHLIRGHAVDLPPTKRGQVGHSSVLEPKLRTPDGARAVAVRLVEKAAERLRAEGFHAGRLLVAVASHQERGWSRDARFPPSNSTTRFLRVLTGLWREGVRQPHQVAIALRDLTPDRDVTRDLFDDGKAGGLDFVIDAINRKHGRETLTRAAGLDAVAFLAHGRIPFGQPTDLR